MNLDQDQTQLKETINDYEALRKLLTKPPQSDSKPPQPDSKPRLGHPLPEMTQAFLEISVDRTYDTPAAVWGAIAQFQPCQGWICGQSAVDHYFRAEQFPDFQKGDFANEGGDPLSAELCRGAGENLESLHLRQHDQGGWRIFRYRLVSSGKAGPIPCLKEKVSHISMERDVETIDYEVFWARDEAGGMRRFAARFVGLQERSDSQASRRPRMEMGEGS